MPQNFFVTGMPKSGKTTLLRELLREMKKSGLKVGGFISPEEKHHGTRTGFYVKDIDSGRVGLLADVKGDGPKVSKYHVDVASFESVVIPALDDFEKYDAVVIDEIGAMELKSRRFSDILERLLESKTPLIASLHRDFIERYELHGDVIELGPDNHEDVYQSLLQKVKDSVSKKPPEKEMKPERKIKPKATKAEKKPEAKKAEKKPPERAPVKEKPILREETPKKEHAKKKGIFDRLKGIFR